MRGPAAALVQDRSAAGVPPESRPGRVAGLFPPAAPLGWANLMTTATAGAGVAAILAAATCGWPSPSSAPPPSATISTARSRGASARPLPSAANWTACPIRSPSASCPPSCCARSAAQAPPPPHLRAGALPLRGVAQLAGLAAAALAGGPPGPGAGARHGRRHLRPTCRRGRGRPDDSGGGDGHAARRARPARALRLRLRGPPGDVPGLRAYAAALACRSGRAPRSWRGWDGASRRRPPSPSSCSCSSTMPSPTSSGGAGGAGACFRRSA